MPSILPQHPPRREAIHARVGVAADTLEDKRYRTADAGEGRSMTDDREHDPGAEDVSAPAPYGPVTPSQNGIPLAPPLSDAQASGPPPYAQAPGLPPYAQAPGYPLGPGYPQAPAAPPANAYPQSPGYPQSPSAYPQSPGGYPVSPPYAGAGYPASSSFPPPTRSSKALWIVLGVVGVFVVLSIVGVAVLVGVVSSQRPEPIALPTNVPAAPSDPAAPSNPAEDPETGSPDAEAGEELAEFLEEKKAEYVQLRDSGALWQQIPDTEFNRTALTAFFFFVADMKVATIWGVTAEQAAEYTERVAMLEERLLAQQPLGDDIQMTTGDRVFTYDGETGEGGWAEG
jgi:hypothetical protein